jgi:hypothetical protein
MKHAKDVSTALTPTTTTNGATENQGESLARCVRRHFQMGAH